MVGGIILSSFLLVIENGNERSRRFGDNVFDQPVEKLCAIFDRKLGIGR